MRLHIEHRTRYDYRPAVDNAQHTAHLQPRPSHGQTVHSFELHISPRPDDLRHGHDAFGNPQAWWSLPAAHNALEVVARSVVDTTAPLALHSNQPWEAVREHFRYRSGQPGDPQTPFVFGSHHAPLHEQFAAYAHRCFAPDRPLQEAAVALMHTLHRDMRYVSQSTDVHTPALQALQTRRGVCQDFAHVLIACLRSLGLAARYVSGYLLTQPPPGQERLVGADASHAWASVYVPELAGDPCGGWLDLDPTNNLWGWGTPSPEHVLVAWGRDFADVSPLRGVLHGSPTHRLQVGVSVTPAPNPAA